MTHNFVLELLGRLYSRYRKGQSCFQCWFRGLTVYLHKFVAQRGGKLAAFDYAPSLRTFCACVLGRFAEERVSLRKTGFTHVIGWRISSSNIKKILAQAFPCLKLMMVSIADSSLVAVRNAAGVDRLWRSGAWQRLLMPLLHVELWLGRCRSEWSWGRSRRDVVRGLKLGIERSLAGLRIWRGVDHARVGEDGLLAEKGMCRSKLKILILYLIIDFYLE